MRHSTGRVRIRWDFFFENCHSVRDFWQYDPPYLITIVEKFSTMRNSFSGPWDPKDEHKSSTASWLLSAFTTWGKSCLVFIEGFKTEAFKNEKEPRSKRKGLVGIWRLWRGLVLHIHIYLFYVHLMKTRYYIGLLGLSKWLFFVKIVYRLWILFNDD